MVTMTKMVITFLDEKNGMTQLPHAPGDTIVIHATAALPSLAVDTAAADCVARSNGVIRSIGVRRPKDSLYETPEWVPASSVTRVGDTRGGN